MRTHEEWMNLAIYEALKAGSIGEVPIGAIVVKDDQIIGRGYNYREAGLDPTLHAEMIAIREASQKMGAWRLSGCTLYVTLEPCPMCAGAIVQARVDHVVYGAADPKAGCAGTLFNLLEEPRFNHQPTVLAGIMEQECGDLLRDFFRDLRAKRAAVKIDKHDLI